MTWQYLSCTATAVVLAEDHEDAAVDTFAQLLYNYHHSLTYEYMVDKHQ